MPATSIGRLICRSGLPATVQRSFVTTNVNLQTAATTQQSEPNILHEKPPPQMRPLYMDVQATTPMASLTLKNLKHFCSGSSRY